MRTLEALKKVAAKLTNKTASQVTGDTVDEVLEFANTNFKIAESMTAYGLVLTSPDESIWDISVSDAGTLTATKRES